MQASTSGPKNRLDISYIFSQKTTVPEKEEKILKLFQDNSISRDTWLVYEELWRAIRKKTMRRDCVVSMKVENEDENDDGDDDEEEF